MVLGDRFEMLSAAVAALPFALPVAHIHGGEASEGAMDNQIRHAITKLAHLHFASAPEHARRIAAMGEEAWRIHSVGAPGLDRLRTVDLLSRDEVAAALGLPSPGPWLLVTFHPVTLEYAATVERVAPEAWFINFTNPAGLITQALMSHTNLRVIGICDTPSELFHRIAWTLGEPYGQLDFQYFGLNHLGWVRGVTRGGEDVMRTGNGGLNAGAA